VVPEALIWACLCVFIMESECGGALERVQIFITADENYEHGAEAAVWANIW